MRGRLLALAALLAALVWAQAAQPAQAAQAADEPPWRLAADLRTTLADAERALIMGEDARARERVREAAPIVSRLAALLGDQELAAAYLGVERAVVRGDEVELAAGRAGLQTAVLGAAYRRVLASLGRGDVAEAEHWLLVREFRPPTRFSRPGADATLAVALLADGRGSRKSALAAVRADYLDTYQARLRTSLETGGEALGRGFATRVASESALARGYFAVLEPSYRGQRGAAAAAEARTAFDPAGRRRARPRRRRLRQGHGTRWTRSSTASVRRLCHGRRRSGAQGSSSASSRSCRSSTDVESPTGR